MVTPMRKIYFYALTASLLFGCTKSEEIIPEQQIATARTFVASIEGNETRVHAEGLSVVWDDRDEISVIGDNNYRYIYSANDKEFSPAENEGITDDVSVYAVYPYAECNTIVDGKISLTFPAEQSYAEDSFGPGANVMIAKSSDDELPFKNVGAYLKLQLYGEGVTVKSISFQGNSSERLAGAALLSFDKDGTPVYEWNTTGEDGKVLTLNCPIEGVELNANKDDATIFWLVVPPQTFEGGFTIAVKDSFGRTFTKSTENPVELKRNWIIRMAAIELSSALQPADEVWCYDAEGNVVPVNIGDSGAISVANFLPIDIDHPTLTPSGENLLARAAIRSIVIPEGVTSIDMAAFAFCTYLESVVLPSSLETIGMGAFGMCQSLKSVDIPENVSIIGDLAFMGCAYLESVDLPDNLKRMGTATFAGCTSLESVTIPDSVEGSLHSTFSGCTSLTEVSLGKSIVELNHSVFSSCTALESITIPANIEEIEEGVFSGCTSLKEVIFADESKLRFIWNSTFEGCTSLESIILPASLGGNSEADDSFVGSGDDVDGVGVPILGTARGLGAGVFNGCTNLKTVYSLSLEPLLLDYNGSANTYPFPYENDGFKVYVPNDAALTAYNADANWSVMGECIQVGTPPMP